MPPLVAAPSPGHSLVDFEERVNFDRLREYRLRRTMQSMEASDLGAVLVFDNNNIRYLTGIAIGEWTREKLCRYAIYTRTGELILWDFGSAAVHNRLHAPWMKTGNCLASWPTMRGAVPPGTPVTEHAVREIKGGRVEFRTDRWGIVHVAIGKVSFEPERLEQNLAALVDALVRNKPSAAKGQYLKTLFLAASMGPSVPVDVREAAKLTTA